MALSGFAPCASCNGLGFDGQTLEMCPRCGGHGHLRPSETSASSAGAGTGSRTMRMPAYTPATSPAPLTCPKCGGWMYAERDGQFDDGTHELACVRCGKRLYLQVQTAAATTTATTRQQEGTTRR